MDDKIKPGNPHLESIVAAAWRAARKELNPPRIHAVFYPYAGLSSTIRLRTGGIYVRVSDLLIESPAEVLYALACILIAKLYRRRVSEEQTRIYRQYAMRPDVVDATESIRRRRGYKIITSPRGKLHDLDQVFDSINSRYFDGAIERPLLSWSQGRTGRVLGHHDHVHGAIVVSRTLDAPEIPRLALEYVMYHEMLHIKHPPKVVGQRTVYHGAEFRAEERRFEGLKEATEWLERLARPVRRRRRRR